LAQALKIVVFAKDYPGLCLPPWDETVKNKTKSKKIGLQKYNAGNFTFVKHAASGFFHRSWLLCPTSAELSFAGHSSRNYIS